jgi:hypothetical protein
MKSRYLFLLAAAVAVTAAPLCAQNGYTDWTGCNLIGGWAWNGTASPINVDVYDGPTLIASTAANLYRPDLEPAGIGNGIHCLCIPHSGDP